jgi:hypothetical protein
MQRGMDHAKHAEQRKQPRGDAIPQHDLRPAGLKSSTPEYVFEAESKELPAAGGEFRFAIRGPDGGLVREFARAHERELHLILVSTDLNEYTHLHPARDAKGNWSAALPPKEPGRYRLYADFVVKSGPALTLADEVSVPGAPRVREVPQPSKQATVDGFEVAVDGNLEAGAPARLLIRVFYRGAAVKLESYLGANAHLVVIRATDGEFLHAHPLPESLAPGEVAFSVDWPSAGRYRLFVDFQVEGTVRTAAFTIDAFERDQPLPASSDGQASHASQTRN